MPAVDVFGRVFVPAPTASQAAALDRRARERAGVPERLLMENAGRSAALLIHSIYPRGRIVAAVGSGNNGGDALVALRTLAAWGRDVAALPVGSTEPKADLLHEHSIPMLDADSDTGPLARTDVLVDGLLGTGARGAPRAPADAWIGRMNASGCPIVALDLPSGVDPDTGAVPGEAIAAAVTISFGAPKVGLLFQPGRSRCGRLFAVEIGFPPPEPDEFGATLITPGWAAHALPARRPDAHKGSAGKVVLLAGGAGMGGAGILAARGAVRGGAGLVYLASHAGNRSAAHSAVPDAIFVDRETDELVERCEAADALVAGSGMGREPAAADALKRALEALPAQRPALLDADAVTLLAQRDALKETAARRPLVITPHPGEFARAARSTVQEVTSDPVTQARQLAGRLGCVVLLKGMPSIVAVPNGAVRINTVGSSDLASAGMGDHLAGVVGALLGAGVAPEDAAALGLFYSSRAADLAARGRALSPWDVSEALSDAFGRPGAVESPTGLPFVTFDQPPRW